MKKVIIELTEAARAYVELNINMQDKLDTSNGRSSTKKTPLQPA